MAQPNYGFAKRQRELAKKQKKEDKKRRKEAENAQPAGEGAAEQSVEPMKDLPQP